MNESIMKAIAESIPSMQMEELRKELDKAKKYDNLLLVLESEQVRIKVAYDRIASLEADNSAQKKDILKKEEIEKRERNIEIELLKKDLSCAKEISQSIRDIALAAFKNPTVSKSYNMPLAIPSGGWSTTQCGSETETIL